MVRGGDLPDSDPVDPTPIHARSVLLSDESLGAIARIDLVESNGLNATPVDYKRGTVPDVPGAHMSRSAYSCAFRACC